MEADGESSLSQFSDEERGMQQGIRNHDAVIEPGGLLLLLLLAPGADPDHFSLSRTARIFYQGFFCTGMFWVEGTSESDIISTFPFPPFSPLPTSPIKRCCLEANTHTQKVEEKQQELSGFLPCFFSISAAQ